MKRKEAIKQNKICHLSLAQLDAISQAVEGNEFCTSIPHIAVKEVTSDPGSSHPVSS